MTSVMLARSTSDECNALVSSVIRASSMACSELCSHNSDVGLASHSLASVKFISINAYDKC